MFDGVKRLPQRTAQASFRGFQQRKPRNLENGNKAVFAVCNRFYPNLFVEKSYFMVRKSWVRTYRLARFVAGSEILTGVFVAALRMTLKSALAIDGLSVADAGGETPPLQGCS